LFKFKFDEILFTETGSSNKNEILLKCLIEMVSHVIGTNIADSAVRHMVAALLPHAPMLQVLKTCQVNFGEIERILGNAFLIRQDWTLICNILMEDESGDDEVGEALDAENKAMLAKFLVATLQVVGEDSSADARPKGKGKKVQPSFPFRCDSPGSRMIFRC
jgi:hypothetical protein